MNYDGICESAKRADELAALLLREEGDPLEQAQELGELWKKHSSYEHLMHFMADHVGFDSPPRRVGLMLANCIRGWRGVWLSTT